MGFSKEQLLSRLKELQIDFESYVHPVVMTVEAQAKHVGNLGSGLSKNLFLKDKKHRFYVVSALAGTTVDLKVLSQRLGLGKGGIRMAPEEALKEVLQVPLGCVTPFALINESACSVSLLLDEGFKAQEYCFFHPLLNDMTISLAACDLDKFLVSIGRQPSYVDLEANPVVGKDQPPDLAYLVPSEVSVVLKPVEKVVSVQVPVVDHVPVKKSVEVTGKAKTKASKGPAEKQSNDCHTLASLTDIAKFVDKIIQKTSQTLLSEHGEKLGSAVLNDARERVLRKDLEILAVTLKNAAYTQGFMSGRDMSVEKNPFQPIERDPFMI